MNFATPHGLQAIVIGASAGGVEAVGQLLAALRPDAALALFVVIHLPRDARSLLPEVFGARCALPVCEPLDKQPVAAGTVYVAAPDYHLLVDAGPRIALSVDELVHFSRPAIDVLFESAALVYGPNLLGVVLTGGNEDGAQGLAAVQRAGGTTIVQDPADARVRAMPEAALAALTPSAVLALEDICRLFATFGKES